MSGVWHALTLVGIGVAAGAAVVNAFCLLRLALDLIPARDIGQPRLWPDPRSVTVWTGVDWFTVTVMPVAFGRWGVAVRRDATPRRAEAFELVERLRSEPEAHRRAHAVAADALRGRAGDRVAVSGSPVGAERR